MSPYRQGCAETKRTSMTRGPRIREDMRWRVAILSRRGCRMLRGCNGRAAGSLVRLVERHEFDRRGE
jgi:hypothetical protein